MQKQCKTLDASKLTSAEFAHRTLFVNLDDPRCTEGGQASLEDAFKPAFWRKMVGKIKPGDLVRLEGSHNGAQYSFEVSAVWVGAGGIGMRAFPHKPQFVQEAFDRVQREELELRSVINQHELGGVRR
jgi:hypothetical protein